MTPKSRAVAYKLKGFSESPWVEWHFTKKQSRYFQKFIAGASERLRVGTSAGSSGTTRP